MTKAHESNNEADMLTIAYMHGHAKGKDEASERIAQLEALLEKALAAYDKPTSLEHQRGVFESIRAALGKEKPQ